MYHNRTLVRILYFISIVTVITGSCQVLFPAFMMGIVGSEISTTTMHFFATEGMFMVLFGGLLWHVLKSQQANPIAVLWCGLQKIGATLVVSIGVSLSVFNTLTLTVAAFDFASGLLIIYYWYCVKRSLDKSIPQAVTT